MLIPLSPLPTSVSTHGVPPAIPAVLPMCCTKNPNHCSLLHLSQMFSLAALWELSLFKHKITKLIPSKWRQIKYFLILSRKCSIHSPVISLSIPKMLTSSSFAPGRELGTSSQNLQKLWENWISTTKDFSLFTDFRRPWYIHYSAPM